MGGFKTIGILGGMGPEATLDLYRWIVKLTSAKIDQDHIPTIINSYPQIPDRTRALLHGGENPLPYLIKGVKILEKAGADFIIIPCNTSHKFLPELQKNCKIPIINMIEEAGNYITKNYPFVRKVGLLATTGTIKTRIYHDVLEQNKLEVVIPDGKIQEGNVMKAVYGDQGIKAGFIDANVNKLLVEAANHVYKKGAQIVIMGCTEIPLSLKQENVSFTVIDPVKILAEVAIKLATGKIEKGF